MDKAPNWIKKLKLHLVDSTAVALIYNPFSAFIETNMANISDDSSIDARILATTLIFGGGGSVISKGRDLWRKMFGVTDKTLKGIQHMTDATYFFTTSMAFNPIFYYVAGLRDWKEITILTLASTAAVLPLGFSMDLLRYATGLKRSKRIPKAIRKIKPSTKKGLTSLVVAASFALTAGIYASTPNKIEKYDFTQKFPIFSEVSPNYRTKGLENLTYKII